MEKILFETFLKRLEGMLKMKFYLDLLMNGQHLTSNQMKEATEKLLHEDTNESQIASFLTALRMKGETTEEIAALVEGIRKQALPVQSLGFPLMDNCGTGGDHSNSFNISTTSAFVLSAGGVAVAKHGNRSISSNSGSADVFEHLGVSLTASSDQIHEQLSKVGLTFLFAQHVHPKLKKIVKVRKELKIPTIFNVLGPLTNPLSISTQLVGVFHRDYIEKISDVLHLLGRKRAVIVHGNNGMDEASLSGENELLLLEGGKKNRFTINPDEIGLPSYMLKEIEGGNPKENADILLSVLKGKKGAYLDTVLLNAGIGFFASGRVNSIQEGVHTSREVIRSGKALIKLQELVELSKRMKKEEVFQ
jgi:anthranilate phosphoribosyltransferase